MFDRSGIKEILLSEAEKFTSKVKSNIQRVHKNNDYFLENTIPDGKIHSEATDTNLTVWGWAYFDNVERGIPPLFGRFTLTNKNVKQRIFEWTFKAGISFASESKRKSFAWAARQKIGWEGTRQFRSGGRKDIYTSEVPALIEGIETQIGKKIIETKLL